VPHDVFTAYRNGGDEERYAILRAALDNGGWGRFWAFYGIDKKR
jgi:hypothetical protein